MRVIRLDDTWAPALDELLLQAPTTNLFLLGVADALSLKHAHWYGVPDDDRLRAVCLVLPRRLLVPFAPDPIDATHLGRALRPHHPPAMLVGPREAADAFWAAFAPHAQVERRYDQRLYQRVEPPGPCEPIPGFRKATLRDLPSILEHSRQMEHEDLGRWPDAEDPKGWRQGVADRVQRGHTWVIERSGALVFQIHVGTVTRWGAQVGGTWVPPEHRGQGLAVQGMRGLIRALLPGHRRLTLHVNEANEPAVRTYERVGFQRDAPFRLQTVRSPA